MTEEPRNISFHERSWLFNLELPQPAETVLPLKLFCHLINHSDKFYTIHTLVVILHRSRCSGFAAFSVEAHQPKHNLPVVRFLWLRSIRHPPTSSGGSCTLFQWHVSVRTVGPDPRLQAWKASVSLSTKNPHRTRYEPLCEAPKVPDVTCGRSSRVLDPSWGSNRNISFPYGCERFDPFPANALTAVFFHRLWAADEGELR